MIEFVLCVGSIHSTRVCRCAYMYCFGIHIETELRHIRFPNGKTAMGPGKGIGTCGNDIVGDPQTFLLIEPR